MLLPARLEVCGRTCDGSNPGRQGAVSETGLRHTPGTGRYSNTVENFFSIFRMGESKLASAANCKVTGRSEALYPFCYRIYVR